MHIVKMEVEPTKTKKLTANAVLKEFNLSPTECYDLLSQVFEELEKHEETDEANTAE